MVSKATKIILYPVLFIFSFLVFLYWMFPYDILKERVTGMLGSRLGGLEVEIGELKPYWFSGIDVRGFAIGEPGFEKSNAILELVRLRVRASVFSLLTGRPDFSFTLNMPSEGEMWGSVEQAEDSMVIDAEMEDIDIGAVKFLASRMGLNMSSRLNGAVELKIDNQNMIRTSGKLSFTLPDFKIAASQAKFGELVIPIPDTVISKGRESGLKINIDKGVATLEGLKLAGGDFVVDLKGKVFLSSKLENCRFNLSGSFSVSQKLGDALPFLFIIEQQKQTDGSFPITVTGRFAKPLIKIGNFTVPI